MLKFSLFTLALTAALISVVGSPIGIKQGLKDSNIYGSIVDNSLDAAQKDMQKKGPEGQEENNLPLDNPEVRNAIKAAFSPGFLQTATEQIIDGTYKWLDGRTEQPDFAIDLTTAKQRLAESLGEYAVRRAQSLPVCTLQQARELQNSGIDPLNIPCVPPGFDTASLHGEVTNQINNDDQLLKNTVITADTLKDDQGKSPFEKMKQAPKAFNLAKNLPYALSGLAVLTAGSLILLHDERRRGIRQVGIIILGTGIFLVVGTLVLNYLFKQVNKPGGSLGNIADQSFQQAVTALFKSFTSALNGRLIWFGAIYALIGGGVLAALKFTSPKKIAVEEKGRVDDHAAVAEKPSDPKPEDTNNKPSTTQ